MAVLNFAFVAALIAAPAGADATSTETAASHQGSSAQERWISEWGDGVCRLTRARGEPLAAYLTFEVVPGSTTFDLLLLNPEIERHRHAPRQDVAIRLMPVGTVIPDVVLRRYVYRGDRIYVVHGVPTAALDALASATAIRIERSGERLLELALPSTRLAMPVLRDCIDDQLRVWGFDPSVYNALSRPPQSVGNMVNWVSDADYPLAALNAGRSGRTVVRVTIGVDGRARDCVVIHSAGDDSLDRRTCQVSRRGRFEPALDASGRAVETPFIYAIHWRIES